MSGTTWAFAARGRLGITALSCAIALLIASAARADQITAKGDTLNGKLIGMGDGGVIFETAYAKDKLTIKYEDISDLRTEGPVQVLYGEDGEAIGPLQGIQDGKILVGASAASATPVELASVTVARPTEGESWRDRARSNLRYWHGSFDVGLGLTRSRVDDSTLLLGLSLTRKKAPTRFFLDIIGSYGKEKSEEFILNDDETAVIEDKTETRSQDSLLGRVRGEYDLTKKLYAFGSGDAQYDGVQELSIRTVPKAGVGYRIWENWGTKTDVFQVEAGAAWVYEKYFGGDDNNFWALALGSFLDTGLWYGSRFTWRADYLPSIDDWVGDYLLRNELALTVPIFDPFKLKLALIDEYDSTPATDDFTLADGSVVTKTTSDHNKLIFTAGLSLTF